MAAIIRLIGQNFMPQMPMGNIIRGASERGIKAFEESSLFKRVLFRNPSQIAEAAVTKIEYHGTTTKALGEQLQAGELETGKKLYTTPDPNLAFYYALRRRDGSTPVVVSVSGDRRHVNNPPVRLDEIGWNGVGGQCPGYHYLPAEAKKFVQDVSVVNPNGKSGLQRAKHIFKAVFKPKI
jgi:hypothetical protein